MGASTYAADYAAELTNHIAAIENDWGADHSFGVIFNGSGEHSLSMLPQLRKLLTRLAPISFSMKKRLEKMSREL
jgi:hypothetical protein